MMTEITEYWQISKDGVFYTNRGVTFPSELTPELVKIGVEVGELLPTQKDNEEVFIEVIEDETHYLYFDQTTLCSVTDHHEDTYKSRDILYCEKCDAEVKEYEE